MLIAYLKPYNNNENKITPNTPKPNRVAFKTWNFKFIEVITK
jgi:hypothetical protein